MKLIVDRIEENLAICENIETKKMIEIPLKDLPNNIKDGSIIIYENNEYRLDLNEEEERRRKLQEKFNKLRQD